MLRRSPDVLLGGRPYFQASAGAKAAWRCQRSGNRWSCLELSFYLCPKLLVPSGDMTHQCELENPQNQWRFMVSFAGKIICFHGPWRHHGELLVLTRLGTSKSMGVQYSNGLTWMILMIIFGVPPEELRIEYVNRIRVTRQSTPLNFIPGQKELENHQTNDKINKLLLKLVLLPVFFKRALDC